MLHKTRGIALSYVRFKESSIIARVYTEGFGIQSYIVNGVRSSKSRSNRIALFQPLTLLDMVVYHKGKEETIQRISELKCYVPFRSIPFDVAKSSLALFVTEILGKTLREEESNEPLFQFLLESILYLDHAEEHFENFHIHFLTGLASFLGFGIETINELEGELKNAGYPLMTDEAEHAALEQLLWQEYGAHIPIDRLRRSRMLDRLIFFYKVHLEGLGEIKSLDVLKEVLKA